MDFKYPTGPTILKNVNFGLDQSSRVCIVGPNGAGAVCTGTAVEREAMGMWAVLRGVDCNCFLFFCRGFAGLAVVFWQSRG